MGIRARLAGPFVPQDKLKPSAYIRVGLVWVSFMAG
jgi:hypothetical protein